MKFHAQLSGAQKSFITSGQAWSECKPFDTLIEFLEEFFEKVNFEKSQQTKKKIWKITQQG